ncbi:MAG TPA: hypothetical protein VNG53_04280 [Bacteroidia bacterium]|nr:hypothetical protein [Bacteroidia bacterium]
MRLSKIISYLFHPLLMPLLGVILIFNIGQGSFFLVPDFTKKITYILVFFSTLFLPLLCLYIMKKTNQIKNFELETQEERRLPYFVTAVFFALGYACLKVLFPQSFAVIQFMFGATISLLLVMLLNLEFKISAHTTAIGGLIGFFASTDIKTHTDLHLLITVLFFISGFIGYARLRLKVHQPAEVYIGFLLGFMVEMAVVFL